jgi:hypothetical protein
MSTPLPHSQYSIQRRLSGLLQTYPGLRHIDRILEVVYFVIAEVMLALSQPFIVC